MTYGTFRPDERGDEFPPADVVERDFEQMAANGLNAVRTYTVPPARVLEAAARHGLRLMIGLAIERSIGYLNDRGGAARIEQAVRRQVAACAGHPALLCYAIGNEIPASIVRWFGPGRIERLLERLTGTVRGEDPDALVTYANYPSTEYLRLPSLDLVAFNVYLEDPRRLDAYVARLQNIAADRPLVMTELGLDAVRHGEQRQAASVEAQVRTAFGGGCAGAFVFAWTDDWHRGGEDVFDWGFGLTRRDRGAKPVLGAVRRAFAEVPPPILDASRPRVSVVVCTRNGAARLSDCLDGLLQVEYPDFEVIVIDDGSTDATAAIAREYPIRVITTEPQGLSAARNRGLQAATGEIVAYLDDDARPDPHWLSYLAATFMTTNHAGVGGPNIAPPDAPPVAQCVDNAPGGPTHVLLSDRVAEHIPGCNMAFRRERLEAIGGFDPQFHVAGDDVDVCWRLQERGWTLGFSPAAAVFHHRRDSVRGFLRQQRAYGRAEALLERKWPEKYTGAGHAVWSGRLYGNGVGAASLLSRRARIYYGAWGEGLFQRLYSAPPTALSALLQSPEGYLVIGALGALCALGLTWHPLLAATPLLTVALALLLGQAVRAAARATYPRAARSRLGQLRLRLITTLLRLLGPAARLAGRLAGGLSPWRYGNSSFAWPRPRNLAMWTTRGRPSAERLRALEAQVRGHRLAVRRGGAYDRWDLEVRGGVLGGVRLRMGVEEHAGGAQLVRVRCWPRWSRDGAWLVLALGGLAAAAVWDGAVAAGAVLAAGTLTLVARGVRECGVACWVAMRSIEDDRRGADSDEGS